MKYMRHPITGQVQPCSPLMAKRLQRYQWEHVTRKEYDRWKHEQVQRSIFEALPPKAIGRAN